MRVTITVENGDQEVEVTRTGDDVVRHGSNQPLNLGRVFDQAVADVRRACEIETEADRG